jgi:hypothetical protein
MPLEISSTASTILIRRSAYESSGLTRAEIDLQLGLTDQEFRVERDIVVIGPIFDAEALSALLADFDQRGLIFFDDFFELSGNWPGWLTLFVTSGSEP